MSNFEGQNLISSKEILKETGISRATLNNYIKVGIIPRPIVRKSIEGFKNIKNLGYFPKSALERIEEVKRLKKRGNSMRIIAGMLNEVKKHFQEEEKIRPRARYEDEIQEIKKIRPKKEIYEEKPKLTLEEIPFPAYLINFDFEIVWINHEAEEKILNQEVGHIDDAESRNIFKLLFKWEFHCHVQNWKDLIAYHISFAKFKFSKIWLAKLYKGISSKEVDLLEKVYDDSSSIYPDQLIKDTHINLLRKDGFTEQYRVYSIFFKEGIFFVYVPADELSRGINRRLSLREETAL
jgi:DNA-binding transcriptional MerR regulator